VVNLKDLREAKGLTQLELGLLAGLSQPELSLVESGARGLSSNARMRIIRAFDLTHAEVKAVPELSPFQDAKTAVGS
jgi:transcriptional regulator with XRE-family HTH domain